MNEQTPQPTETTSPPTQAQLYDDLRRIGQLEDQKHANSKGNRRANRASSKFDSDARKGQFAVPNAVESDEGSG